MAASREADMAKILCVLYDDPVDGHPSGYARDDLPKIERYPDGQTLPTPKATDFQPGELRLRFADDGGGLRRFVNVYLGGEDIRFLDGLDTPVSEGDELTILQAVAGG
jgi:molybdopterin converting factor small subunit